MLLSSTLSRSVGRASGALPLAANLERSMIRCALRQQPASKTISYGTTRSNPSRNGINASSTAQFSRSFSTTQFREAPKTMAQLKTRHATGPFSWKAALLFVITGASMIVYFRYEKARLQRKRIAEMSKGVGKPKVGGPFTLKDLDGNEFTHENLKGRYSFVWNISTNDEKKKAWLTCCSLRFTSALPIAQIFAPTSWTKWPPLLTK